MDSRDNPLITSQITSPGAGRFRGASATGRPTRHESQIRGLLALAGGDALGEGERGRRAPKPLIQLNFAPNTMEFRSRGAHDSRKSTRAGGYRDCRRNPRGPAGGRPEPPRPPPNRQYGLCWRQRNSGREPAHSVAGRIAVDRRGFKRGGRPQLHEMTGGKYCGRRPALIGASSFLTNPPNRLRDKAAMILPRNVDPRLLEVNQPLTFWHRADIEPAGADTKVERTASSCVAEGNGGGAITKTCGPIALACALQRFFYRNVTIMNQRHKSVWRC